LKGEATSACAEAMLTMRPALLLHRWKHQPGSVKGRAQVEGDDGVPLVDRELLHRRDVLDAGVVDEDVDRAEAAERRLQHRLDGVGLRHVGAVVGDVHLAAIRQAHAQALDLRLVAESVEDDVRAALGERLGDAQADPACRAGD